MRRRRAAARTSGRHRFLAHHDPLFTGRDRFLLRSSPSTVHAEDESSALIGSSANSTPAGSPWHARSRPPAAGHRTAHAAGAAGGPRHPRRPASPEHPFWTPSCPASRPGRATFCSAVSAPMKFQLRNTKSTSPRRSLVSSASDAFVMSQPALWTWPWLHRSSAAAQCGKVDLPDPAPRIAGGAGPTRSRRAASRPPPADGRSPRRRSTARPRPCPRRAAGTPLWRYAG
jgi:hypothetical protein